MAEFPDGYGVFRFRLVNGRLRVRLFRRAFRIEEVDDADQHAVLKGAEGVVGDERIPVFREVLHERVHVQDVLSFSAEIDEFIRQRQHNPDIPYR